MPGPTVTILCGGFGAARFLPGLVAAVGDAGEVTAIVNTGDDTEFHGLHVCPDLDSVLYALAGCFDETRGWGPESDSFHVHAALRRYGSDWFTVGDQDLALHLRRTELLRAGATLTGATRAIAAAWGVRSALLPVTDDALATFVHTADGTLSLQEYLVVHRAGPAVTGVEYVGAEQARATPEVLAAIEGAEIVVLAPSNPVISLGPILAVPAVHDALVARRGPTVAVSPVVVSARARTAAEDQRYRARASLMGGCGLPHRPSAVADLYAPYIDGFVVDERDRDEAREMANLGVPVLKADTLAPPGPARSVLAGRVLAFARDLAAANGPGPYSRPTR
ncbi:MAG TPA: 2-phospho-L-lactate transferase [Acidimicrobiales bacterium]|nr:2-phospho-L-lactate transferase [Acidimicrobiales bacterium]